MNNAINKKKGFTLIELMIAIVIVGILSSIAVPFFRKYVRASRATTFANDIRLLSDAGNQYALESGTWINTSAPGSYPPELQGYFSERKFELGSSLGGEWLFDRYDDSDFTSAVGVDSPAEGVEVFAMVDKLIDDGDLSTGLFQKSGTNRYYLVIED